MILVKYHHIHKNVIIITIIIIIEKDNKIGKNPNLLSRDKSTESN